MESWNRNVGDPDISVMASPNFDVLFATHVNNMDDSNILKGDTFKHHEVVVWYWVLKDLDWGSKPSDFAIC